MFIAFYCINYYNCKVILCVACRSGMIAHFIPCIYLHLYVLQLVQQWDVPDKMILFVPCTTQNILYFTIYMSIYIDLVFPIPIHMQRIKLNAQIKATRRTQCSIVLVHFSNINTNVVKKNQFKVHFIRFCYIFDKVNTNMLMIIF